MSLEKIVAQLKADPRNKQYTDAGIDPLFQVGPRAKILIIGQAPGRKAALTMIPFDDKSGETLIGWLGIDRATFYSEAIAILPMDFYYPGKSKSSGDKPPRAFIAEEYHKALLAQMPDIQLTILIGQYAQKYYLGKRRGKNLTETVRRYADYLPTYFPIVHPSPLNFRWQAKNPWFVEDVVPALQKRVSDILA